MLKTGPLQTDLQLMEGKAFCTILKARPDAVQKRIAHSSGFYRLGAKLLQSLGKSSWEGKYNSANFFWHTSNVRRSKTIIVTEALYTFLKRA